MYKIPSVSIDLMQRFRSSDTKAIVTYGALLALENKHNPKIFKKLIKDLIDYSAKNGIDKTSIIELLQNELEGKCLANELSAILNIESNKLKNNTNSLTR